MPSGIRCRKAAGAAICPHGFGLVGLQERVRTGARGADQDEVLVSILGKIGPRGGIIHVSFQEAGGACETPALVTDGGQTEAGTRSGVPDVLFGTARKLAPPQRSNEGHLKHRDGRIRFGHGRRGLRIVKAAVLTVGRMARLAAAEVAGRDGFAVTLMGQ